MQVEQIRKVKISVMKVLEKQLTVKVADEFREKLLQIIDEGNTAIVLDLSEVDLIDSSGLGAIVSCLRAMGPEGEIAICGATESVRQMFQLTRMDSVFDLYSSQDEAMMHINR